MLRFILFLLFTFPVYAANTNLETKNYVSTKTYGQLGNQLFNVATTMAYAWDHDLIPTFPFLNESDLNKSFNRDHLFFRLPTFSLPVSVTHYGHYEPPYKAIPPLKNVLLDGYFFSWKYFHHYRNEILALYAPSEHVVDYLKAKYSHIIDNPKTVAVHVRTFSADVHQWLCPFVGIPYFELAFAEFPADYTFVVFSDRTNWCKAKFSQSFPDRNFVYIDGNNHVQDLFLMSLMRNFILSNSTYSWWGAYLCTEPNAKVYAPQIYLRPWHPWKNQDFYLPEWKVIPYNSLGDTYPEDMTNYDSYGKSLQER